MLIKFPHAMKLNGRTVPTEWTEIANPEAVFCRSLDVLIGADMQIMNSDNGAELKLMNPDNITTVKKSELSQPRKSKKGGH